MIVDMVHSKYPKGLIAILLTVMSLVLGGAYYAYLVAVAFPPDLVRVVPFIWLAGAFAGLIMGLKAIHANSHRYLGIASLALNVPNIVFAAIFAFAALMGG